MFGIFADTTTFTFRWLFPIGCILTTILLIVSALALVNWLTASRGYDRSDGRVFFWTALAVTILVGGATFGFTYPFKYEYHHWVDKKGIVEQVSSRLISAGDKGGSNQRFVVVVNGEPLGVDDTRASLIKVGDSVFLKCKKEYEFGTSLAANGWACKWGAATSTRPAQQR